MISSVDVHTNKLFHTKSETYQKGMRDAGYMGIAVGISFLSCVEAEICVISDLLPVNGSQL